MSSPVSDSSVSSPEKINTSVIKRRKSINHTDRESSLPKSIYPSLSDDLSENDEEFDIDDEENKNEKDQQNKDKFNNSYKSSSFSNLSSTNEIYEQHASDSVETIKISDSELKTTAVPKSDQKPLKSYKWIYIVIVALIAIVFSFNIKYNDEKEDSTVDCSAFLNMNKFPNQDEMLWKSLKSGIEGTFNSSSKPQPSIFALFSNDKATMKSIMKEILHITKKCINSREEPINLSKTDLSSNELQEDHTKLILKFKNELKKREIMIMNDIDKVPITVIPSLHSFCDLYNPLVAKSIIFFTIHVPQEPSGKPVEFIHDYLQEKWIGLESNILDPLITRITDQTFFLNKELV